MSNCQINNIYSKTNNQIRTIIEKNALFGRALVRIRAKIEKIDTLWQGFGYG